LPLKTLYFKCFYFTTFYNAAPDSVTHLDINQSTYYLF